MMNREQRRAYVKRIKKNSAASICPECGNLALFYTTSLGEKNTVVKCQIATFGAYACGRILFNPLPSLCRLA